MSNLEVRHPERIGQYPRRGRKGQTALRTCLLGPCAGSGWGALRWGGARPLLRRAPPTSGHRIPRILSRGSGLRFQSGEICSTSAFEEPPISLQRLFASSFYTFSFGILSTLRKGGPERSPFFRPLPNSTGKQPVAGERGWPCGTAGVFVLRSCFLTI